MGGSPPLEGNDVTCRNTGSAYEQASPLGTISSPGTTSWPIQLQDLRLDLPELGRLLLRGTKELHLEFMIKPESQSNGCDSHFPVLKSQVASWASPQCQLLSSHLQWESRGSCKPLLSYSFNKHGPSAYSDHHASCRQCDWRGQALGSWGLGLLDDSHPAT